MNSGETSYERFVRGLQTAGLLPADSRLPDQYDDEDELSDALIDQGIITLFQSNHCLEGNAELLEYGSYILIDELSQGGMGVLYKARRRDSLEEVVIKTPRQTINSSLSDRREQRLRHEIDVLRKLHHADCLRHIDDGEAHGSPYLVTEFVADAKTVREVVSDRVVSEPVALELAARIAGVLATAHSIGIFHRDLKPENVLVSDTQVKVIDWGIARAFDRHKPASADGETSGIEVTEEGSVSGTADWMAPSRKRGESASVQTEIHELGMLLWYLVTGQMPGTVPSQPASVSPRLRSIYDRMTGADKRGFRNMDDVRDAFLGRSAVAIQQPRLERRHVGYVVAALSVVVAVALLFRQGLLPDSGELPNGPETDVQNVVTGEPATDEAAPETESTPKPAAPTGTYRADTSPTLQFVGHTDIIRDIDISPDGLHLISAAEDATFRIWDAGTGQLRFTVPSRISGKDVTNCVFVDNEFALIAENGGSIRLWDCVNNQQVRDYTGHRIDVLTIDYAPQRRQFLSCDHNGFVFLWDINSDSPLKTLLADRPENASGYQSVRFLNDGKHFVVTAGAGVAVITGDLETGEMVSAISSGSLNPYANVFVSPHSDLALVTTERVAAYDLFNESGTVSLPVEQTWIDYAQFLPNGRDIIYRSREGVVRLGDIVEKNVVDLFPCSTVKRSRMAVSDDGHWVFVASENHSIAKWRLFPSSR